MDFLLNSFVLYVIKPYVRKILLGFIGKTGIEANRKTVKAEFSVQETPSRLRAAGYQSDSEKA